MNEKLSRFTKTAGPGILFASTAIGVSHLIQSTRAGAVWFVTAGFFENLFGIDYLGEWTIVILFIVCVVILAIGKYNALDSLIKIVAIVLVVSTVAAFILVLYNGPIEPVDGFITKDLITVSGIFFLLALMGWMPAPLEISSWNSLWTL